MSTLAALSGDAVKRASIQSPHNSFRQVARVVNSRRGGLVSPPPGGTGARSARAAAVAAAAARLALGRAVPRAPGARGLGRPRRARPLLLRRRERRRVGDP